MPWRTRWVFVAVPVGVSTCAPALSAALFEANPPPNTSPPLPVPLPQVTAFICNLDEATVNCGAAEPRTIHLSSSSGSGSGNGPSSSAAAGPSSACASPGGASGSGGGGGGGAAAAPAQFFRLRAGSEGAVRRGGWGWRNCRVAWEEAVRKENRVERMVAHSDPAAAERRLMQRLLVARLEAVSFKGCTGGVDRIEGATTKH